MPGEAILPSVRLTDPRHGDVEADSLIFIPGLGIAVLEVKGGQVRYEDGEWTTRRRRRRRRVQPVQQARRAKHALRRYLDRQPDWHQGLIRSAWFVVLPDSTVNGDLGPEGRRTQIIDRDDLPRAMDYIRAELANPLNPDPFPDGEAIDTAISLILRANPGLDIRRKSSLARWAKVVSTALVVLAASGVFGYWVANVYGWPWALGFGVVEVPLSAAALRWVSRPWAPGWLIAAFGVVGAAASLTLGAVFSVQSTQPWLLQNSCAPGYAPCLPIVDDLDCTQIARLVTVSGDDVYGLDRNGDGTGCESFQEAPRD
jgi:hypothetical protein